MPRPNSLPSPVQAPVSRSPAASRTIAAASGRPAALLETPGALTHPPSDGAPIRGLSDLKPKRGAAAAVARLNDAGYFTVALIDLSAAEAVEPWRVAAISARLIAAAGVRGVVYCDEPAGAPSPRRIPAPGLILEAALTYGLDLDRSYIIAASTPMLQAAQEAGVPAILISEEEERRQDAPAAAQVPDLAAAERFILGTGEEAAQDAEAAPSILDRASDQPLESRRDALLKEGAPT